MWKALKVWWRALAGRTRAEREMDEELRFHIDAYAADLMRSGVQRAEAFRRARMEFGGVEQAKEDCREVRRFSLVESIAQDFRFALRMFRATPTATAAAILTLALGIGANTAIFSLIDRLMLASLPVANPQELAQVRFQRSGSPSGETASTFTNAIWEATRNHQDVFSGIFAWDSSRPADLSQGGVVDLADPMFVSGGFFDALGVRAARGRLIGEAEDHRGCAPVAVLSYAFWQARYGGQESIVGSTISLDKHSIPIVGVSAPGFTGVDVGRKFDVAIPICSATLFDEGQSRLDHRSWWWLSVMGRIKPGLTLAQVNARLATLSPEIFQESVPFNYKKDGQERFVRNVMMASPGHTGVSDLRRNYERPLAILMGVVGLVLLIACANIASLTLARATTRTKELAVRKALGASRARLVRQLLTESILLAGAGALSGVAVAQWGARLLVHFLSTSRDRVFLEFPLDMRVLVFTVSVALLAAILFGLLPAFRATGVSLTAAMKGNPSAVGEKRAGFRVGRWIVAFQVTISLVLMITAGLFLRSFVKLNQVEAGFDRSNVVIISGELKDGHVAAANRSEVGRQIQGVLAEIPGVVSSSISLLTPISGATWNDSVILDRSGAPSGDAALAYSNYVSPHYLETMRIPLVAGRDFDAHDASTSPKVAIINETMARRFFEGVNPIGQTYRFDGPPGTAQPQIQVVGIMRDAKYEELSEEPLPQAFMPIDQMPEAMDSLKFVIRSNVDLGALAPAAVKAIGAINKAIPLRFQTLSQQVDDSLARERALATLSGFFGALALLLATIGLYGALSYVVTQRQAEFGVRLALGAPRSAILKLVLADLLFVLGTGVGCGVLITIAVAGVLQKLLFGLAARDSATMAGAVALLTAVAILASLVPARRAMKVDPAEALRCE